MCDLVVCHWLSSWVFSLPWSPVPLPPVYTTFCFLPQPDLGSAQVSYTHHFHQTHFTVSPSAHGFNKQTVIWKDTLFALRKFVPFLKRGIYMSPYILKWLIKLELVVEHSPWSHWLKLTNKTFKTFSLELEWAQVLHIAYPLNSCGNFNIMLRVWLFIPNIICTDLDKRLHGHMQLSNSSSLLYHALTKNKIKVIFSSALFLATLTKTISHRGDIRFLYIYGIHFLTSCN